MSSVTDWEDTALERRCSHCSGECPGEVCTGRDYLRALQSLGGDAAAWQAHKVEPFFWSDADMMHVRLCAECVNHLGLGKAEEAHSSLVLRPRLSKVRVR